MEERVSIGRSFREEWFIAALVVGGIGVCVGLFLLATGHTDIGAVVLGLGVVLLGIGTVVGFRISAGRRFLTQTDDGFILSDKRGEFEFADDLVSDLGTWAKVRYSNGHAKAVVRRGSIVIASDEFAGRLKFQYEYPLNRPDPLDEFLERVLTRLVKAADAAQKAGDTLAGDGWEFGPDGLSVTEKNLADRYRYPAETITTTDIIDGKVSVWVKGNPKPILKADAGGENALVLVRLLSQRLKERGGADDPEDGLGRIIFERDKSISKTAFVFAAIGVVVLICVAVGVLFYAAQANPGDRPGPLVIGVVLLLVSPAIIAAMYFNRVNVFRCHAGGVCLEKTGSRKELLFKDARVFSYSAVRQYVNGGYTGTTVSLTFETKNADDRIHYAASFKNADDELDNLRDHVSRVIGFHLKARLDAGEDVTWTDLVTFTPDGLEIVTPGGVFKKGDEKHLPYENVSGTSFDNGYFYLFAKGKKNSVYQVPVSAPNFFPGYVLLMLVTQKPAPRDDDDEPGDDIPTIQPV